MSVIEITVASPHRRHSASTWAAARHGFLPFLRRAVMCGGALLIPLISQASAQPPSVADRPVADSETITVEQEVLDNILRQPLGDTTVESLGLPEPFLRRATGRIIRSSYQHRYHVVAADSTAPLAGTGATSKSPDGSPPSAPSTKATNQDQAMHSSNPWPYLVGLGILIGTAAGLLALRRIRRTQR